MIDVGLLRTYGSASASQSSALLHSSASAPSVTELSVLAGPGAGRWAPKRFLHASNVFLLLTMLSSAGVSGTFEGVLGTFDTLRSSVVRKGRLGRLAIVCRQSWRRLPGIPPYGSSAPGIPPYGSSASAAFS